MKKLFNARSPFWQLLTYSVFFVIAGFIVVRPTLDTEQLQQNYFATMIIALLLIAISGLYIAQIIRYNRTHPKTPIRYLGVFPPELKEEDEGMRMFTARATRRVYIFYVTVLPIFTFIYAYFLPAPLYVVAGLALLVLGHFSIYLSAIWPALSDE